MATSDGDFYQDPNDPRSWIRSGYTPDQIASMQQQAAQLPSLSSVVMGRKPTPEQMLASGGIDRATYEQMTGRATPDTSLMASLFPRTTAAIEDQASYPRQALGAGLDLASGLGRGLYAGAQNALGTDGFQQSLGRVSAPNTSSTASAMVEGLTRDPSNVLIPLTFGAGSAIPAVGRGLAAVGRLGQAGLEGLSQAALSGANDYASTGKAPTLGESVARAGLGAGLGLGMKLAPSVAREMIPTNWSDREIGYISGTTPSTLMEYRANMYKRMAEARQAINGLLEENNAPEVEKFSLGKNGLTSEFSPASYQDYADAQQYNVDNEANKFLSNLIASRQMDDVGKYRYKPITPGDIGDILAENSQEASGALSPKQIAYLDALRGIDPIDMESSVNEAINKKLFDMQNSAFPKAIEPGLESFFGTGTSVPKSDDVFHYERIRRSLPIEVSGQFPSAVPEINDYFGQNFDHNIMHIDNPSGYATPAPYDPLAYLKTHVPGTLRSASIQAFGPGNTQWAQQ